MDNPTGALHAAIFSEPTIPKPRLESRRQLPALTGLRFFAAFSILFAHSCDWIAQFRDSEIGRGLAFVAMYGMPLFFVLSGFVIHYNYRDLFARMGLTRAICEFAAARFARLYPLYLCFFLLALGADEFVINIYHAANVAAPVLAYYLTLTQTWWYLVYNDKSIINQLFSVSWSISTEMYFYLLYAALIIPIMAISRAGRAILFGIIYATFAAGTLWVLRYNVGPLLSLAQHYLPDYIAIEGGGFEHSFFRWLFYFSPYVRVLEFFMGCFASQALLERANRPVSQIEYRCGLLALLLALGALAVAGLFYLGIFHMPLINAYVQYFALNFLCAPAIAVILFCVARYDTPFARLMAAPLLVALGEMSYSIYLVHSWTLRLFQHVAQPFTPFWATYAAFRVILAIAFTLLVSYGTYRLIELPGRAGTLRVLRRVIALAFDWPAARPPRELLREPPGSVRSTRLLTGPARYTVTALFVLAMLALCGQALRYPHVTNRLTRFFVGDQSVIGVVSADYGLNCSEFPVAAGYPKMTFPGYATKALREACDGRVKCEFLVSAAQLGDPANGCGKAFSAKYRCSGHPDEFSARIPGEADGKTAILECAAMNTDAPGASGQ